MIYSGTAKKFSCGWNRWCLNLFSIAYTQNWIIIKKCNLFLTIIEVKKSKVEGSYLVRAFLLVGLSVESQGGG